MLVVGASGFVGSRAADVLSRRFAVHGTYRRHEPGELPVPTSRIDLDEAEGVDQLIRELRPEIVVNLVGPTEVESAPRADGRTPTRAIDNLLRPCRPETTFVFLSTDYVFDGTAGPYSEEDEPGPINDYGRVKLAEEEAVRESGLPHLIVRTSLVYGWPLPRHHPNFVASTIERLSSGDEVTAFVDMLRTPILVDHLVEALDELLRRGATGTAHVGSSDAVTMLSFTALICTIFDLDRALVHAAPSPSDETPPRPRRCGLRTDFVAATIGRRLPTTSRGLQRMKREAPIHG